MTIPTIKEQIHQGIEISYWLILKRLSGKYIL